ncbi:CAMK family protein kinase [Staphylotrichum tortipilum]|uniref:CAMK family protein kinase n=1 Tax=Staphylotrichum tortipilum TaxID=2831512 RepID=A0AAN6RV35_9PEZI|nr:CAMK family protein kinase [Staphylotrichum longicolle]
MADPALIACLYPSAEGQTGMENALRTIHRNPSRRIEPLRQDYNREPTSEPRDDDGAELPDNEDEDEDAFVNGRDYSFGLRLGFDDERKSALGILIGTSPHCDIVVPKRDGLAGVAPYHCCITFDEQRRLILKDLQNPEDQRRPRRNPAFVPGTAVTYNDKGGQKRCILTWIIAGHRVIEQHQPVIVAIHDNVKFEIVVAPRDMDSLSYQENLNGAQFPNELQAPIKDAILLDNGEVGWGGFAVVSRVWNVSTGHEYASKVPLKRRDWGFLQREINVLKGIRHEHIVNCIPEFSTTEPVARLVLEYVPLGTLEDQHDKNPISVEEAFDVLCQGTSALRYLHEREVPIAHRDIKPSNILVQSRLPLHIKLSDFGLSRANPSYLRTYCGTPRYTAPEIFARENYDAGVDIWSLGVVVLQYAHGLPNPRLCGFDGVAWTKNLVQVVEAEARALRCPLLTFLSTAMLVRDRHERYSAHRCWNMVQQLDPSDFSCSIPTWISQPQDPHPQQAFGAPVTAPDPTQLVSPAGRSPTVTTVINPHSRRFDAPSPSPLVSVRRMNLSRVSKPAKAENKSARRRERGGDAVEELAYFYDKFSSPLHQLYVGSSLAQATNEGDVVLRRQLETAADGAAGYTTGPRSGTPEVSEGSVEKRVYLLGDMMRKDGVEVVVEHVETAPLG